MEGPGKHGRRKTLLETKALPKLWHLTSTTGPASMERKLKVSQVLDQGDDGEFYVESEDTRAMWVERYRQATGGLPPAWGRRTELGTAERFGTKDQNPGHSPLHGFWVFCSLSLRASKYRTFVLSSDGYTAKELPGSSNFVQWRACFRVLRSALLMLECVSMANIHLHEMHIEKLTRLYASAWHLVYSADDLARSAHANRTRSRILMDIKSGKMAPDGWDPMKPWDTVYKLLVSDERFWQEKVHGPALAWIAAGSKGPPKTPAEQHAMASMMGGVQAIQPNVEATSSTAPTPTTPSSSKLRRDARKKRMASEREELKKYRSKEEGTKGKGKGKEQPKQLCYGWNNGNGPCASLSPGQSCVSKTPRAHRCTVCGSPGHPSRSCPQRKEDA